MNVYKKKVKIKMEFTTKNSWQKGDEENSWESNDSEGIGDLPCGSGILLASPT